jgi:hypothetical protein
MKTTQKTLAFTTACALLLVLACESNQAPTVAQGGGGLDSGPHCVPYWEFHARGTPKGKGEWRYACAPDYAGCVSIYTGMRHELTFVEPCVSKIKAESENRPDP